jgi:hypothetical protein
MGLHAATKVLDNILHLIRVFQWNRMFLELRDNSEDATQKDIKLTHQFLNGM